MECKHVNVISSSIVENEFNEVFSIECSDCNSVIHENLSYDDFISVCKNNAYIVSPSC